MLTTTEKTVRDIAIETPSSIRVFESLGIDYCCGGKRSLSEACTRANISIDRVAALLEAAERGPLTEAPADWSQKPLCELIAHVVDTHHVFVRTEIPRLESLLAKVVAKHSPAHAELPQIERLFVALGQELSAHMMKEEQILFPYIANMGRSAATGDRLPPSCFGTVTRPIANMVAEHEDAGALLAQIRELSRNFTPPAEACPSFIALYLGLHEFESDLHQHIHLENNLLFPRAIEMEQGCALPATPYSPSAR